MKRLFFFAIVISLGCFAGLCQNRQNKAHKSKENVNYAAEAERYLKAYDVNGASGVLERWEKSLNSSGNDFPSAYEGMRARTLSMKNLLERVEKIELIDTLLVDSVDFFANYMLSPDAGDLLDAVFLPEEYAALHPSVVYMPQNGKEMLWAIPAGRGRSKIVRSQVLDDGTVTEPEPIGDEINDMGSTDFPFVQSDGITVYFAAKGDNSLGGYDIFMTRRGMDGELMQPQNIGMPYNSPYNDFMMVIDDARNLGWWASDRNGIPGKLTIYVFRPSPSRVNYNPDSEGLIDNARLRNHALKGGLEELLNDKVTLPDTDEEPFVMSMGNGKVYTSLSDFKNGGARKSMEELLLKRLELEDARQELDRLRVAFGKGDKKRGPEIRALEKRLADLSNAVKSLTTRVVTAENK